MVVIMSQATLLGNKNNTHHEQYIVCKHDINNTEKVIFHLNFPISYYMMSRPTFYTMYEIHTQPRFTVTYPQLTRLTCHHLDHLQLTPSCPWVSQSAPGHNLPV